jgi:hypothetical protein
VVVVTTNSARPNEISRATRGRRAIRQNTDEAGIVPRQRRDRKAVRRFLAAGRHETIHIADEAILSAREDRLKPGPVISEATRTTRFGHVGRHHQPDLPLVFQELSGRHP